MKKADSFPLLCLSLSFSECMTGGPGVTRGPTRRFKKTVVCVCIRVELANGVRVALILFLNFRKIGESYKNHISC
jgi:hypothetical protein